MLEFWSSHGSVGSQDLPILSSAGETQPADLQDGGFTLQLHEQQALSSLLIFNFRPPAESMGVK